jgi:probable phosphoglycerate mutase
MVVEAPKGFRSSGEEPTGTRIVLIRHGQATCNVLGRVGGPRGCTGLTDLGRTQATALRERLLATRELDDATALYSSILPRAIETLEVLLPGLPGHTPTQDCGVCEMHAGEGDGLLWQELIDQFGYVDWDEDPHQPLAPGGESWVSMYHRVVAALQQLATAHPGERIVVVSHGGVIEHALKWATGRAPEERLRLRTEHCSMTEVEITEAGAALLRYNDRAPLPAR